MASNVTHQDSLNGYTVKSCKYFFFISRKGVGECREEKRLLKSCRLKKPTNPCEKLNTKLNGLKCARSKNRPKTERKKSLNLSKKRKPKGEERPRKTNATNSSGN